MAKSIYGAADSTLVNMAYRAAMANVPLDQTAVFAAREENLRNFTQLVSQQTQPEWDEYEEEKKKSNHAAQEALDILKNGGNPNYAHLKQHSDQVYGFKTMKEAIDADQTMGQQQKDFALNQLNLKMTKYKDSSDHEKEYIPNLIGHMAMSGNTFFDPGNESAPLLRAMLEDHNNKTGTVARSVTDDQEIMYTSMDGTKKTINQIEKDITIKDPVYQRRIQRQLNNFLKETQELAKQNIDLTPAAKARMIRVIEDEATDIHKVRNLSHGIYNDNNHNFIEVFAGQAKTNGLNDQQYIDNSGIEMIYNALDRAGGVDMDGKDGITEKDKKEYRDAANALIVRKKILEDPEMYKHVAISWIVNNTLRNVDPVGTMERIISYENQVKKEVAGKNKEEENKDKEQGGTFPTRTAADYKNMINK